ncbi:Uncharacterised protein [Bordetella pertussis]|nr:Uncharacterised protein [Bordetella pertussis]
MLPNAASMVDVMETTLPAASTATRWLVEGTSMASSRARSASSPCGSPGRAVFMLRSGRISAPRWRR